MFEAYVGVAVCESGRNIGAIDAWADALFTDLYKQFEVHIDVHTQNGQMSQADFQARIHETIKTRCKLVSLDPRLL